MYNHKTLSGELFKLYIKYFIITGFVIIGFLCIANIFDIIQRFKNYNLEPIIFAKFTLYKVPFLLNEVVALVSLISMLLFLRRLIKHNELTIILTSGISLWQVIVVACCASFILGLVFLTIINPISTYSLNKIAKIESKITKEHLNNIILLNNSFVFFENGKNSSNKIIKAESIDFINRKLNRPTILITDVNNNFLKRIDAKTAEFVNGDLRLKNAKVTTDNDTQNFDEVIINTDLSATHFSSKLTKPEMMIIWDLPKIIEKFYKSGIPTLSYKTYYYKQLFKPLFMIAMVVFGSCFVNLNQRSKFHEKIIVIALFTGLILYLALEIIIKILTLNGINPMIAIILPILLIILISNFVILHFNEA